MTAIVFLGPTMAVAEARHLLDAIYLPPVKQGDLVSAITTYEPAVVAIIDGEFGQTLSVWHKEVLYALHRGIHVFGASSMGALRAAETDMYGAVGVGDIYRMYATGELTDDDEVALAHGTSEAAYRPLSEPLVNIRATLAAAVAASVIEPALADRLIAIEKAVFFPQRSYRHLFEMAAEQGESAIALERLREFVRTSHVDLKRRDAVALLETIRDLPRPLAPHVPTFEFEWSRNFGALYDQDRTVAVRDRGVQVPLATIATHAALHAPDFNTMNGHALDRAAAGLLAELLEIEVTSDDEAAERRRFRLERKLASDDALAEWCLENHLSADELGRLVTELAKRRAVHRWLVRRRGYVGTTRFVLNELRLHGDYAMWVQRAAAQEQLLADDAFAGDVLIEAAEADDARCSDVELAIDHMKATPCRIPIPYAEWAEEIGITGARRLRVDLLRARAARRRFARALSQLVDIAPA